MNIRIEYQEGRKPYGWKFAFRARVLYFDRKIILVRAHGSHSSFNGRDGRFKNASWDPKKVIIPKRNGGFRIRPEDLKRVRECLL